MAGWAGNGHATSPLPARCRPHSRVVIFRRINPVGVRPIGEFDAYIAHLREEVARRQAAAEARAQAARRCAQALAGILAREYGVDRVLLFGSLATGRFSLTSDIDLACQGLDPARFFAALAHLQEAAGEFAVDLVALETAPATLAQRIREEGVPLFERGRGEGR